MLTDLKNKGVRKHLFVLTLKSEMYDDFLVVMENCLQNFFEVHEQLLGRWDFCSIFYIFLEQLLKFVYYII